MKKTFVFITTLFAFSAWANNDVALKDLQNSPENVAPAFHHAPKETNLIPLNYVNQPPMIPHSIDGYQITKNTNRCLACHSPENSSITGATRISPTHFMDREGNISSHTSPRRYFCLQCHTTQNKVQPIVPNQFKPMEGYGQ